MPKYVPIFGVPNPLTWYPCAGSSRRNVTDVMVTAYDLSLPFILLSAYDSAWASGDLPVSGVDYVRFFQTTQAAIITVEIDGTDVDVVTLPTDFCQSLSVYLADTELNKTVCVTLLYPNSPVRY